MAEPITIVAISGSLRRDSYNTALLRAAAALAPEGVTIEVTTLHGIPLYDGDLEESEGIPETVAKLKDRVAETDGLMISTPEYNNSMSGVLKNGIDWMTRPPKDIARIFRDRPVALMGASPSGFGTVRAQLSWFPVFRTLRTRPWFGGPQLMLSNAGDAFTEDGRLVEDQEKKVANFVEGFAAFVRETKGG